MKITFFSSDPGNHRFIQPIIDRLAAKGYECQLLNAYSPTDADVYWFDFCDNNLIVASNDHADDLAGKHVVARLHSVEAYMGYHMQIAWDAVDELIFVSDHIRQICFGDADASNAWIHVIHNGIDLERFAPSICPHKRPPHFGYVGNIVPQKGMHTLMHYFNEIRAAKPEAKLFLAGLNRLGGRDLEYWNHMKNRIGNVFEETEGVDTNAWLDEAEIAYFIQPSYAESFSLVIGEAMAKGIKPLINGFMGAKDLWPEDLIYHNFSDFGRIIAGRYDSAAYRKWVEDRYDLDKQVIKMEELLHV